MRRVYHGSDHMLKSPQYLGGKPDSDYGNGFYTTEYEDRARREVNKFLSSRIQAILLDGFEVPGITARYALQNKLIYNKGLGGYENESI